MRERGAGIRARPAIINYTHTHTHTMHIRQQSLIEHMYWKSGHFHTPLLADNNLHHHNITLPPSLPPSLTLPERRVLDFSSLMNEEAPFLLDDDLCMVSHDTVWRSHDQHYTHRIKLISYMYNCMVIYVTQKFLCAFWPKKGNFYNLCRFYLCMTLYEGVAILSYRTCRYTHTCKFCELYLYNFSFTP